VIEGGGELIERDLRFSWRWLSVKINVFWCVTPCGLVHGYNRFTASCRLRVQCFCSIVYVHIARLYTWSGNFYQTTCLHVPKFTNLCNNSHDKFKSQQINKSTSPLTTRLFQVPIQSTDPIFFLYWRNSPPWAIAASLTRFLDHTQRLDSSGRMISSSPRPLPDKKNAQQTSMSQVGFFFYLFYSYMPIVQ